MNHIEKTNLNFFPTSVAETLVSLFPDPLYQDDCGDLQHPEYHNLVKHVVNSGDHIMTEKTETNEWSLYRYRHYAVVMNKHHRTLLFSDVPVDWENFKSPEVI